MKLEEQVRQALNPDVEPWAQHCSGDCKQGRLPCRTPEACMLPEKEDPTNVRIIGASLIAFVVFTAFLTLFA